MSINLRTSAALSITGLAFGGIALLSSAPAEASTADGRLGDRPMVSRFERATDGLNFRQSPSVEFNKIGAFEQSCVFWSHCRFRDSWARFAVRRHCCHHCCHRCWHHCCHRCCRHGWVDST